MITTRLAVAALLMSATMIGVWSFKRKRDLAQLQRKPWERRIWRGGIVTNNLGVMAVFHLFMASLFLGVAIGFALKSPHVIHFGLKEDGGWVLTVFIWAFAATGAGILIWGLIAVARWLRFGRCRILMTTLPGVIGGRFAGILKLPASFPRHVEVHIELVCEQVTSSSQANNSDGIDSRNVQTLWEERICVRTGIEHGADHSCEIPFEFIIPYRQPHEHIDVCSKRVKTGPRISLPPPLPDETDESFRTLERSRTHVTHGWSLRVFAELPGADLDLKLSVPVFKTNSSTEDVQKLQQRQVSGQSRFGEDRRVQIVTQRGNTVYVCGPETLRNRAVFAELLGGLVFTGLGLTGGIVPTPFLLEDLFKTPRDGFEIGFKIIPIIGLLLVVVVSSAFTFFGFIFLKGAVFRRFARRETWVKNGVLHHRRTLFGISLKQTVEPAKGDTNVMALRRSTGNERDVFALAVYQTKSAGRRSKKIEITVASDIASKKEAEKLAAALRVAMSLPEDDEADD